jgi:hypothetical protein
MEEVLVRMSKSASRPEPVSVPRVREVIKNIVVEVKEVEPVVDMVPPVVSSESARPAVSRLGFKKMPMGFPRSK